MKKILVLLVPILLFACSSEQQSGINPLPNFDALWNYQYPDSTEIEFTKILKNLQDDAEVSYDKAYHAELLTQIARAQGLQGNFDQAHQTLGKADSLISEKMPVPRIRYLLEKGRVLNSSGESAESKSVFLEAYEFGKANQLDLYTLDAAHMLGIVDEPKKQMDWNLIALDIAENSQDTRCKNWLGPLYNNIGWTYHDQRKYEKALAIFRKDLEWRKTRNHLPSQLIAKWSVARSLRALNRTDEAKQLQLELIDEYRQNGMEISGYVHEELGELSLLEKDREQAAEYFGKAYEKLSKDEWLQQNEPARLERLKKLGNKQYE